MPTYSANRPPKHKPTLVAPQGLFTFLVLRPLSDLFLWLWRMERRLEGRKFALVIDGLQAYDERLWVRLRQFLRPLSERIPAHSTNICLFLGNYERTPYGIHRDPELRHQERRRFCPGAEFAVNLVRLAAQGQHQDPLLLGIDNPVLRDAGAGVLSSLGNVIAFSVLRIGAHDLHHQVGPFPERLTTAVSVLGLHEEAALAHEHAGEVHRPVAVIRRAVRLVTRSWSGSTATRAPTARQRSLPHPRACAAGGGRYGHAPCRTSTWSS